MKKQLLFIILLTAIFITSSCSPNSEDTSSNSTSTTSSSSSSSSTPIAFKSYIIKTCEWQDTFSAGVNFDQPASAEKLVNYLNSGDTDANLISSLTAISTGSTKYGEYDESEGTNIFTALTIGSAKSMGSLKLTFSKPLKKIGFKATSRYVENPDYSTGVKQIVTNNDMYSVLRISDNNENKNEYDLSILKDATRTLPASVETIYEPKVEFSSLTLEGVGDEYFDNGFAAGRIILNYLTFYY